MSTTINKSEGHHSHDSDSNDIFGFWVYIMSDCILFATIFATYIVLLGGTYGGPAAKELFSMKHVLIETLILLTSSFTYGLGTLAAYRNDRAKVIAYMIVTFLLGVAFVGLELNGFIHLIHEGNSWTRSAYLSAYFTLVGTHGLHVTIGLIWMAVLTVQISMRGIAMPRKKIMCLGLFWHFLDIVWIFVFTIVYLMGAI